MLDRGGWNFRWSGVGSQMYFLTGLVLVVLGLLFISDIVKWIVTFFGFVFIVLGILALIMGFVTWLSELRGPRQ